MTGRLILKKLVKDDFPDTIGIEIACISVETMPVKWTTIAIFCLKLKTFPLHIINAYNRVIIIFLLGPAPTIELAIWICGASNYDWRWYMKLLPLYFLEWVFLLWLIKFWVEVEWFCNWDGWRLVQYKRERWFYDYFGWKWKGVLNEIRVEWLR